MFCFCKHSNPFYQPHPVTLLDRLNRSIHFLILLIFFYNKKNKYKEDKKYRRHKTDTTDKMATEKSEQNFLFALYALSTVEEPLKVDWHQAATKSGMSQARNWYDQICFTCNIHCHWKPSQRSIQLYSTHQISSTHQVIQPVINNKHGQLIRRLTTTLLSSCPCNVFSYWSRLSHSCSEYWNHSCQNCLRFCTFSTSTWIRTNIFQSTEVQKVSRVSRRRSIQSSKW